MPLTLDRTIKASDVLTSLTVILSVIALLYSWSKDQDSRTREQADKVRTAAAKTLAKLERWQGLQRSMYRELQPVYVETSEMLAKRFDVSGARDYLWKQINAQRVRIAARVLDEGIETAYVDLFAYYPSIRESSLSAVANLKEGEEAATLRLLHDTQTAVKSFEGKGVGYQTAMLGNALRDAAGPIEQSFVRSSDKSLEGIRRELYTLISREDQTLLSQSRKVRK